MVIFSKFTFNEKMKEEFKGFLVLIIDTNKNDVGNRNMWWWCWCRPTNSFTTWGRNSHLSSNYSSMKGCEIRIWCNMLYLELEIETKQWF